MVDAPYNFMVVDKLLTFNSHKPKHREELFAKNNNEEEPDDNIDVLEEESQSKDPNPLGNLAETHRIDQVELNDLVKNLDLFKKQSEELLASKLKR
ncbi:hypothetical protein ILUMI_14642 [Ignelater luminosus]|uniref:Uncharacterized protein n=1 Tax=Ignelater luminosus TaxID=2038154 RepID=A0A8K0CTU6_IGNLU|nr:hypothetical protein ILUMI_14642 [Ignelater luminosus]